MIANLMNIYAGIRIGQLVCLTQSPWANKSTRKPELTFAIREKPPIPDRYKLPDTLAF